MTCQSLISDLSDVESPSVATARMHLLRRFSRYGPEKLAPHAGGPCVRGVEGELNRGCAPSPPARLQPVDKSCHQQSRWI